MKKQIWLCLNLGILSILLLSWIGNSAEAASAHIALPQNGSCTNAKTITLRVEIDSGKEDVKTVKFWLHQSEPIEQGNNPSWRREPGPIWHFSQDVNRPDNPIWWYYETKWDVSGMSDHHYSLTYWLIDRNGKTIYFGETVDFDSDRTIPGGSITSPSDGQTITGDKIHIAASASDNLCGVDWVKFLVHTPNERKGSKNPQWDGSDGDFWFSYTDYSAPWSPPDWDMTDIPDGDVTITIWVSDKADNVFEQPSNERVTVHVNRNNPPNKPTNPSPSNGQTGVSINPTLSWTGTDPDGDSLTYEVYFGTTSSPPKVRDFSSSNSYNPGTLSYNQKYYWKIVVKDEHGAITVGDVWSFTTGQRPNNPPNKPTNPFPSNGQTGVSINPTLSWTDTDPDGDSLTYEVYFGTTSSPPKVRDFSSSNSYNPGTLSYNQKYYWKIVASDGQLTTEGDVWNFTTEPSPPLPPDIEVNPPSWDYGNVNVGDTLPKTFKITNVGGTTLNVNNMEIIGDNRSEFLVVNPSSLSLNTGESYNLIVSFEPTSPGPKSATLRLWSDDPDENPKDVRLSGTGVNRSPNQPSNPSPANHATNVSINTTLNWNCTDPDGDPLTYDIYFGAEPNPPLKVSDHSGTTYNPGALNDKTTYYWKIVAKDNHNASTPGPMWDFITEEKPNNPPNTPSNPSPANHSTGVSINTTLSWVGGDPDVEDTVEYDVYFDANNDNPPLVASGISDTSYNPGALDYDTTYYWKIVAKDNHGASTTGPIWDFITKVSPTAADSFRFPVDAEEIVSRDEFFADPGKSVWYDYQNFGSLLYDANNCHLGSDINHSKGDFGKPLYAIANGIVVYVNDTNEPDGWGKAIILKHTAPPNKFFITSTGGKVTEVLSMYAHVSEIKIIKGDGTEIPANQIIPNQTFVQKGWQIAKIGNGNGSTVDHLHFEIRTDISTGNTRGPGYNINTSGWIDAVEFIKNNRNLASDRDLTLTVHTYDDYNPQGAYFSKGGTVEWVRKPHDGSNLNLGYNNYVYQTTTDVQNWAKWQLLVPRTGWYSLSVHIPRRYAETTRAKYLIHRVGQNDITIEVNQWNPDALPGNKDVPTLPENVWVSLGRYYLEEGIGNYVKLDTQTKESPAVMVAADAIKIVSTSAGGGDLDPPVIIAKQPAEHVQDVAVTTTIEITFSESMHPIATAGAVSLNPEQDYTMRWDGSKLILTPIESLEYNTAYTVTISDAAQDLAGNPLESTSWTFTTICFLADVNCDNLVDIVDIQLVAMHWNTSVGDPEYDAKYDINQDSEIDIVDIQLVANEWNKEAPFVAPSLTTSPVTVRLNARSQKVDVDKALTVDVVADGVIGIQAMEFHVAYDAGMLSWQQATMPAFKPLHDSKNSVLLLGPSVDESKGLIAYGGIVLAKNEQIGSPVLASLEFIAQQAGETAIELTDVKLIDTEGRLIPVTVQNQANVKIAPPPPHRSALAQNYPNPFNPETWIPFKLASDSHVEINIYDAKGQFVKRLDLGVKEAGYYMDKSSAAHWDGRSQTGERVASGLYFYTIKAGKFTATRRMVMVK